MFRNSASLLQNGILSIRIETMRRFWKSTDTLAFENNHAPLHFPRVCVRIAWAVAVNALLVAVGLALIGVAGEAYFRLIVVPNWYGLYTNPKDFDFHHQQYQRFVPNVGLMPDSNSEIRYTNHQDYWTISRTNSLGFMDREPISPERAAESCHITLIGDSFVQAKEVLISDKAHVKLEELAASELPYLNVTTSAFGQTGSGQINQLAFYDEHARHLSPNVLALVFVRNDFQDNLTILPALRWGLDPDHMPWSAAARGEDGDLELRPPDPDYEYKAFRLPLPPNQAPPMNNDNNAVQRARSEASKYFYFAKWLDIKTEMIFRKEIETLDTNLAEWTNLLRRRPRYSALLQGWTPTTYGDLAPRFAESDMPPVFEEALLYTEFALEKFKQRADRDGSKIVILAEHRMKKSEGLYSIRLNAMADELDIPVIYQRDYIVRIGEDPKNVEWKHDFHWNKNGHLWAAEALLEWLRNNQDVCDERG